MMERVIIPDSKGAALRCWTRLTRKGLFLNSGALRLLKEIDSKAKYLIISISEDGTKLFLKPALESMEAFRLRIYRERSPYGIVYSQKLIKEIGWPEGVYQAYREGGRLAVKREG